MNRKNFLRRFGGLLLGAAMLSGVVMASGTTAQARGYRGGGFRGGRTVVIAPRVGFGYRGWGPRWYGYPYYRSGYSEFVFANSAAAESQGYHDGLKTGQEDAKKGKSFDPERSHFFQDAGFGNFAESYREGFSDGYNAGFRS
jgi:hypothetical protein